MGMLVYTPRRERDGRRPGHVLCLSFFRYQECDFVSNHQPMSLFVVSAALAVLRSHRRLLTLLRDAFLFFREESGG